MSGCGRLDERIQACWILSVILFILHSGNWWAVLESWSCMHCARVWISSICLTKSILMWAFLGTNTWKSLPGAWRLWDFRLTSADARFTKTSWLSGIFWLSFRLLYALVCCVLVKIWIHRSFTFMDTWRGAETWRVPRYFTSRRGLHHGSLFSLVLHETLKGWRL